MRIIKLIIISILVLFIIITIISLFIPSHIRISKAIQINASKESVMNQISNPEKWKNWYPGIDSIKYFYKAGVIKGIMLNEEKQQYLILSNKKNNEVTAAFTFPNKKILTGWEIVPTLGTNSVTVQWYIDFHLNWYPWEKFTSFMFERIYNPQLQKGLDNLKTFLEK